MLSRLIYTSTSYIDSTTVGLNRIHKKKEKRKHMVTVALFVRLEAKPGKEAAVAEFLRAALPLVQKEPATEPWSAVQMGPSSFGIFDAFPDDAGRETHLSGPVGAALKEKASELFAQPPTVEKLNVLAAKLSQQK